MTTQFLTRLKNIENVPKEQIRQQVSNLLEVAKNEGLSSEEINDIVSCIVSVKLNRKLFETLVYCMIPSDVVPYKIVEKVFLWILTKRLEHEKDVECLLFWIICLLDYQLVSASSVNEYYCLLWPLLVQYPVICCHLLYTLTQPEDVVLWRVKQLQSCLALTDSSPSICALLNRFKELNSKFADIVVPANQKIDKIFQHKNPVYRQMRANLGSRISSSVLHLPSILIQPVKKTVANRNRGLLPKVQYLHIGSNSPELSTVFVHDIKTGSQLAKMFHKITLPSHTLSLLGDTIGMHVLMFSPKSSQEQFIRNLQTVLEQSLIYKRNSTPHEVEKLLNDVIKLHCVYQQGFAPICNVLSLYLQTWDGNSFKTQIYKLIEWFVFKSAAELNRFLLRPLHTLFVSSDSQGMCEILVSLSNLIMNLYSTIDRQDQNSIYFYPENVLRDRDDILPIIKSLTKFIAELFKMALYIHPCNNQILLVAIVFYERMSYFERVYDVSWWTIVPSNILYHCLFSFNAQLVNQICFLFTNYNSVARLPVAQSTNRIQEKVRRLQNCYQDIYNILWSSRAFVYRTDGHIFRGLSVEDEANWKHYANLNSSLNLERHIMIAPYRMMNAYECNTSFILPKDEILNVMRNHTPHLMKFVELLRKKIGDAEDGDFECEYD